MVGATGENEFGRGVGAEAEAARFHRFGAAYARNRSARASRRWRPPCPTGSGTHFVAAVDTIRAARGRVIVTGMGKSGHVARKIAATLRLHRNAGLFRASPPTPATAISA